MKIKKLIWDRKWSGKTPVLCEGKLVEWKNLDLIEDCWVIDVQKGVRKCGSYEPWFVLV